MYRRRWTGSVYIGNRTAAVHQVVHDDSAVGRETFEGVSGARYKVAVVLRTSVFADSRARTAPSSPGPKRVYEAATRAVVAALRAEALALPALHECLRCYEAGLTADVCCPIRRQSPARSSAQCSSRRRPGAQNTCLLWGQQPYQSIHPCVRPYVRPSARQCARPSGRPAGRPAARPPTYPSIYPSFHPSVRPPARPGG